MVRAPKQSKRQRPIRYPLITALVSLLLLPLLSLAAVAQLGWPNLPALREAVQQEQASPALNAYLEALETELSRLQERYRQQEAQIERLTGDLDAAERQLASLGGQAEPLSEPASTLPSEEPPLALPSSGTVDPAQNDASVGQPIGSGAEAAAETASDILTTVCDLSLVRQEKLCRVIGNLRLRGTRTQRTGGRYSITGWIFRRWIIFFGKLIFFS